MRTVTTTTFVAAITVGLGSLTAIGAAHAEEARSDLGVALALGGGVEGFTGESMRDAAGAAATWDVRAVVGGRSSVSGELAYIGSLATIDAPIGGQRGTLVSSGAEALVRVDLRAAGPWHLYGVLGAGWRRYTVTGADFRMPDTGMHDSDDVLELPLGLGLAYQYGNVLADARATFRGAIEEDLVVIDEKDTTSGDFGTMHTWSVSARLGYQLW